MDAPTTQVSTTIADIEGLGLEDLRGLWREHYGAPPRLQSAVLMRLLLAWHLQAERLGGLEQNLRRKLLQKGNSVVATPRPGTRIVREWRGRRYEVLIDEHGPTFEGKRYRSLSQIARTITGVRWNGPRFFGLRQERHAA